MASKKYKFLLMYGQSKKKVEIFNEGGATKQQLLAAVTQKFGFEHCEVQVWDEDFDEFVDIEDDDLLEGPKKIQITITDRVITPFKNLDVIPVTLYKNIAEFDDDTNPPASTSKSSKNSTMFADTSFPSSTSELCKNLGTFTDASSTTNAPTRSENPAVFGDTSTSANIPISSKNIPVFSEASFTSNIYTAFDNASFSGSSESSKNTAFADASFSEISEIGKNSADASSLASTSSTSDVCQGWQKINWYPKYRIPTFPEALTEKIMSGQPLTASNDKTILDIIYESVKCYTVYPTSSQYHGMVNQLLERYPKLSPDMDTWTNQKQLWITKLKYKFQNSRKRDVNVCSTQAVQGRKRKEPPSPRTNVKAKSSKYPPLGGVANYLPLRGSSEDDTVIEQHIEWLRVESYNATPNLAKVSARMDITFPHRRDAIFRYMLPDIKNIEERYPWLFRDKCSELLAEFRRIHGECGALELLRRGLDKYAAALLSYYKNRRSTCKPHYHHDLMTYISESEKMNRKDMAIANAAIVTIPALLYETNEMFVYQGDVETSRAEVYVETDAKYAFTSKQFTLFVNGTKICRVNDMVTALACYLSAFYIFHLKYVSTVQKTLEFCQVALMDITDKLCPIEQSVLTLISRLNKVVAVRKLTS